MNVKSKVCFYDKEKSEYCEDCTKIEISTLFCFDGFNNQCVNAILFDLDSTVMASKSGFFEPWVLEMFDKLSENFCVAILSNNKRIEYIEKAKHQCNIDVVGHANKPNPRVLLNYLTSKNIEPQNAVMVGDRQLTDILAGKLAGTKTILVDSITRETEPKLTRFVRFLERLTIRK